jgi:hypothetical protein
LGLGQAVIVARERHEVIVVLVHRDGAAQHGQFVETVVRQRGTEAGVNQVHHPGESPSS